MNALVQLNKCELDQILKQQGYEKRYNGYMKQCKGGRLHLNTENINGKLMVILHYDKYKKNQNKKYHHATHWMHPYVKEEMKNLLEEIHAIP